MGCMRYVRMPIEVESPEEFGYGRIRYNLSESSVADRKLSDLNLSIPDLTLLYTEHRGSERLRGHDRLDRDGEREHADRNRDPALPCYGLHRVKSFGCQYFGEP